MSGERVDGNAVMTIHFIDCGQDFLEWDIDKRGVVIGCRPFQAWAWKGARVIGHEKLRAGSAVNIEQASRRARVNYPARRIVRHKPVVSRIQPDGQG